MKKTLYFLFVLLSIQSCKAQNNSSKSTTKQPNIIFIEVDDLPAHFTTMMGAEYANTPTIDKLSKEGVFFSNAVAQGSMCGPSRNSLIVGKYPHNLGFYQNGPFKGLPLNTWALPAALQRAGYTTSYIGKSHLHPSTNGFKGTKVEVNKKAHQRLGFDEVWHSLGRAVVGGKEAKLGKDAYIDFLVEQGYYDQMKAERKTTSTLPDDIYLDGYFTKMSKEFIVKQDDKPYFLWLNYSVPHGPYDVNERYHTFTKKQMPEINYAEDAGENIPDLLRPHIQTDPKKITKEQLGNFANISFMDEQVSKILEAVEKTGEKDNTIIVFFSDHGILVGDHGLNHKSTLYKEVINPTLIVFDPRNKNNGRTVDKPVELLDLLKTTMEWAHTSKVDLNQPYGESLIPLLTNNKGYSKAFAVAECPGYYAIVTKDYKYIAPFEFQKDGFEVLFDLKNDPNEKVNIAQSSPKLMEEYRAMAKDWLAASGEVKIQKEKPPKNMKGKKKNK